MKLGYVCAAWLAGIGLAMWSAPVWVSAGAILAFAVVSFAAVLIWRRRALIVLLCFVALLGGVARFESSVPAIDPSTLGYYNEMGTVRLRGVIGNAPEAGAGNTELVLRVSDIDAGDGWCRVSGSVLVYAPRYPSSSVLPPDASREPPFYRYGDVLEMWGALETPPMVRGFDWESHLRRQGISSVLRYPSSMEFIDTGRGSWPLTWVYSARNGLSKSLETGISEPQSSVARAILLGQRGSMPESVREEFSRTGMSHVVAISGLHVGILGGMAVGLGAFLFGRRRPTYFILAVAAIWLYATLTGLHAPAVRAAIMASLWLFAGWVGRPRSALPALLLAAALMSGLKPSIVGDVSFQLSFAAMAGLILLTPGLQSFGRRWSRSTEDRASLSGMVVDSAAVTTGAVLATLPIVAYYFNTVSLVTLPANLVALPALPGAILGSAVAGVSGLVWEPLAHVVGWVAWLHLTWITEVAGFFADLPFASVEARAGAGFVWAYYCVLGASILGWRYRRWMKACWESLRSELARLHSVSSRVPARYALLPPAIICALVWTAAVTMPDDRLHVYFLDVGQGDAILVQRGHTQILIDGGPASEEICLELGDKLPFWDRTIELAVLTHADADHLTGLVEVVRRYDVERVLTNGRECDSAACAELERLIDSQASKSLVVRAGDTVVVGGDMKLEVLHPPATLMDYTSSGTNNNSVVLRLVYGDFRLLLTGDIFVEAESCILDDRYSLDSTVLKVAHHGSDTSSCPEFLEAVDPQVAVISVGRDNDFGHPSPAVLQRIRDVVGADMVFTTADHGTIDLVTDGTRIWARTD